MARLLSVNVGLPRDALRRPLNCVLCILSSGEVFGTQSCRSSVDDAHTAPRKRPTPDAGFRRRAHHDDSNHGQGLEIDMPRRLGIRPIHFIGGEPLDMVLDQTCFPSSGKRQGHELVFTQYAVKALRQTRLDRPGATSKWDSSS